MLVAGGSNRSGGDNVAELAASVTPNDPKASKKDVNFLRIDCYNVALGIAQQAEVWKTDYGNVLHTTSKTLLEETMDKIERFQTDMSSDPKDLTELKFVLNVIGDISDASMDMELDYLDVAERYKTLERYGIPVPEDELAAALSLGERTFHFVGAC